MNTSQQFSLAATHAAGATEWVFTLPPQLRPFKLEAIRWRYTWGAGPVGRNNFVRISYAGTAIAWEIMSVSSASIGGNQEVMVASPDIGNYQLLNPDGTAGSSVDKISFYPLPSLVLDSLAKVQFGVISTNAADIADQGSIMVSYPDEPASPWWLRRKKT